MFFCFALTDFFHADKKKALDPSMGSWEQHLLAMCRYLATSKLNQLLFETQVFVGDFFRAGLTSVCVCVCVIHAQVVFKRCGAHSGITSVKFACDGEVPLSRRKQYLRDAKSFFEQGLQSQVTADGVQPVSTLRLFLSRAEAAKVSYTLCVTFFFLFLAT